MGLVDKWDKQLELVTAHPECTNGCEKDFIFDMAMQRDSDMTLTIHQSFELNRIFHKVDDKLG